MVGLTKKSLEFIISGLNMEFLSFIKKRRNLVKLSDGEMFFCILQICVL